MLRQLLFAAGLLFAAVAQTQSPAPPARTMHIRLSTAAITPVPISRASGAILIDARIAGERVKLLFDNGSQATVIDAGFARAHGLALAKTNGGLNTGVSTLAAQQTETIVQVGEALTMSGQFLAADLGGISRALGTPVAGMLGADALKAFVVVVNPARGWIAFGLPGHIDVHGQAAADAPRDTQGRPRGAAPASIAFTPDYGIAATANGQPVTLEIDYGHIGALILRDDIWERVIPPEARSGQTATSTRADGLQIRGRAGVVKTLALGNVTLRDMPASSQPRSDRIGYEGLLGLSVLGGTATVLDHARHLLWMFPPGTDVSVSARAGDAAPPAAAAH